MPGILESGYPMYTELHYDKVFNRGYVRVDVNGEISKWEFIIRSSEDYASRYISLLWVDQDSVKYDTWRELYSPLYQVIYSQLFKDEIFIEGYFGLASQPLKLPQSIFIESP